MQKQRTDTKSPAHSQSPQPRRRPAAYFTRSQHASQSDDLHLHGSLGASPAAYSDGPRASHASPVELRKLRSTHSAQDALEFFPRNPTGFSIFTRTKSIGEEEEKREEATSLLIEYERYFLSHQQRSKNGWRSRLWQFRYGDCRRPPDDRILSVVENAFSMPMDIPVLICDVKANCGTVTEIRLGEIEQYWKKVPDDVILRWIHAPLGQGILQSVRNDPVIVHSDYADCWESVEDLFRLASDRGRAFTNAGGTPGYPFVQVDALHFRQSAQVQQQRDILEAFAEDKTLQDRLNHLCFQHDNNERLKDNVTWREGYLGRHRDYWDFAMANIPLELAEGLHFQGPLRPHSFGKAPLARSLFDEGKHPLRGTRLFASPFRLFHRNDRMLLTMSAATGVDQLHKNFEHDVRASLIDRVMNPDSSVVGSTMRNIEKNGASNWREHTVEWFLVFLVTEIGIAPQNLKSGHSIRSLLDIYQEIVIDLKRWRYDRWERHKTIKLVQDYLACADDLRLLKMSYHRRLEKMQLLMKDLELHRAEDDGKNPGGNHVNNPQASSAIDRVQWATRVLAEDHGNIQYMLEDINEAFTALFRLRSIEQNELTMITETQNRALFIFTAVTVIFLPLSFFTSYFGMNLDDIRNTSLDQSQFWTICGTIALAIILLTGLIALRYQGQVIRSAVRQLKGRDIWHNNIFRRRTPVDMEPAQIA